MIFPPPLRRNSLSSFSSSSPSTHFRSNSQSPSSIFKLPINPSIKPFNIFFKFLFNSHKTQLLLHIFSQISSSDSIKPNSQTHSLVARSLLKSDHFKEAREITSFAQNFNFIPQKGLWDALIQCIGVEEGNPERAFSILHHCVEDCGIVPSLSSFHSLVFEFGMLGMMEKAIEVLEVMRSERVGYPFDDFVCSCVISGFCRAGKSEVGVR